MAFNELNTVEHAIIHKLTGVNLNDKSKAQEPAAAYGVGTPPLSHAGAMCPAVS